MPTQEPTASQPKPKTAGLLTYDQAAAYLNETVHWVRRRRSQGDLPYIKLGRHVRFRVADLDAYIEANYQSASE